MGCQPLQLQTILYTLPLSRLVYEGTPLPRAVTKLDQPQLSPGEGRPQSLHQGSWPRPGPNPGPPEWAS